MVSTILLPSPRADLSVLGPVIPISVRHIVLQLICTAVAIAMSPPHSAVAQQTVRSDTGFMAPIEFQSSGTIVRGTMHVSSGAGPHRTIVRLQGFPGSDDTSFEKFAQANGINALLLYFRGQVQSDGIYSIAGTADDAMHAVAFLRTDDARSRYRIDPARITLLGSSAGTYATLRATAADTTLRCVAAMVPFNWAVAGVAARSRERLRQARIDELRRRFVDGPVLVVPGNGERRPAGAAAET